MIGIIGAYGNIGSHASKILYKNTNKKLRFGGRNPDKADKFKRENDLDEAECQIIDINDSDSIYNFAQDCDIILNCSGPSHDKSVKVAAIVTSLGCKYVDVGYDEELITIENIKQDKHIIYHAGSIPGLSGVLPRYLSAEFDQVENMEFYYAALGIFTPSAAEDYLQGIFEKSNQNFIEDSNNTFKNNMQTNRMKNDADNISINKIHKTKRLPLSSREVDLIPFFDNECTFVLNMININNAKWYMAIDGENTNKVMRKSRYLFNENKEKAIEALCTASYVDCLGRETYSGFVVQMKGIKNGEEIIKTLIVKTNNSSYLTAAVAATTTIIIERNILKPGIYPISKIDETEQFITILNEIIDDIDIKIYDGEIEQIEEEMEGEI